MVDATEWNTGRRLSYEGRYSFDEHGRPLNPRGRTGTCERGLLGKWGPNHAADPIVTRFDPQRPYQLQMVRAADELVAPPPPTPPPHTPKRARIRLECGANCRVVKSCVVPPPANTDCVRDPNLPAPPSPPHVFGCTGIDLARGRRWPSSVATRAHGPSQVGWWTQVSRCR